MCKISLMAYNKNLKGENLGVDKPCFGCLINDSIFYKIYY